MTEQEIVQLAVEAGLAEVTDTAESLPSDYIAALGQFAALVAEREREACLAEIETGIWLDKTTEEVLAEIAAAIHARGKGGGAPC